MDTITEREEYEMSLYGFSIKDFKRESKQLFFLMIFLQIINN